MATENHGTRVRLGIAGRSEKEAHLGKKSKQNGRSAQGQKSGSIGSPSKGTAPAGNAADSAHSRSRQAVSGGGHPRSDKVKADAERTHQLAQAKREIESIRKAVEESTARLESMRAARRLAHEWSETPEERALKQKIALLTARERNIVRWIKQTRVRPATTEQTATKKSGKKKGGKKSRGVKGAKTKARRDPSMRRVSGGSGRRRAFLIG